MAVLSYSKTMRRQLLRTALMARMIGSPSILRGTQVDLARLRSTMKHLEE